MSDERISADALREQIRQIDSTESEKRRRAEQESEYFTRFQGLLSEFTDALCLVSGRAREASQAGRAFDPTPDIPQLTCRLQIVLQVLQAAGRMAKLDDLDLDGVCQQAYGSGGYGPKEKIRSTLAFVEQRLRGTTEVGVSLESLVKELCDPSLHPAGPMFHLLLRVLGGLNRFPAKAAAMQPNERTGGERSNANQSPSGKEAIADAGSGPCESAKDQQAARGAESPSLRSDPFDPSGVSSDEDASTTARERWDRDPRQAFERLRNLVSDAIGLVCEIHRQALSAPPDERLANVGSEFHEPLRRAVVEAQAIWICTPISGYLDRPEGSVTSDCEDRQRTGVGTGSCYHDLVLGLAVATLRGIRGGNTAADFTRAMRFRTAAGDHVTQHLASFISEVRCECQQGIVRWVAAPPQGTADRGPAGTGPGEGVAADRGQGEAGQAEVGKPQSSAGRNARDSNKPGRDRQNDILAAITTAKMPLTRPELVKEMRLKKEGKLGHQLAWMVKNNMLVKIPQRGYWPADHPIPE